ncbi:MAG: MarR family winged helix-turn-helix transcriptional regulator [Deltaproteobacteria bacterium]
MDFPQEQLIDLLREVNRDMSKYVKEILYAHDIPISSMIIARELRNDPGITISELSRRVDMAKSHISNLVRDLEQRGWVEKRPDKTDQRILRLYITPAVGRHLVEVRQEIRAGIGTLVADIPADRARSLVEGLEEIKAALANRPRRDTDNA